MYVCVYRCVCVCMCVYIGVCLCACACKNCKDTKHFNNFSRCKKNT